MMYCSDGNPHIMIEKELDFHSVKCIWDNIYHIGVVDCTSFDVICLHIETFSNDLLPIVISC